MPCRELCTTVLKAKRPPSGGVYLSGVRLCNSIHCSGQWVKCDGMFCGCCGVRIRTKPRSKAGKEISEYLDSIRM